MRVAFLVKTRRDEIFQEIHLLFDDSQLWIVEINDGTTRILADNVNFICWMGHQSGLHLLECLPRFICKVQMLVHPNFIR